MARTRAAPEPYAGRLQCLEDVERDSLARTAGFTEVRVARPDLSPFAARRGNRGRHARDLAPEMGQILVATKRT